MIDFVARKTVDDIRSLDITFDNLLDIVNTMQIQNIEQTYDTLNETR